MTLSPANGERPLLLAAVGCSGSKHTNKNPMAARNRYKGSYWAAKRRYGEQVSDDWRVLSAEYAILDPDEPIPYYERVPDDLRGVPVGVDARLPNGNRVKTALDQWAVDVYEGLVQWLRSVADTHDPQAIRLEILVGKKYRNPLAERGVFDSLADTTPADLTVVFPFQEVPAAQGGMFQQIGWMNDCAGTEASSDKISHE